MPTIQAGSYYISPLVALGLSFALILPAQADVISLKQALGMAYETNPQLDAARANLRGIDESVAQANAGWRPTINAGGAYGTQKAEISGFGTVNAHPLQGQVTITQPLFRGGQTYAQIRQAKAQVRAGRAQLTATEQSVMLDSVGSYMDVLRDLSVVQLRQANVDFLKRQSREVSARFEGGELTRTDVSQSEARLAGAQTAMLAAQAQLAADRASFEKNIGRPVEELQDNPGLPALPTSYDEALQWATQRNPALVSARENAKAADFAVDGAVGALLPSVAVQGQYQYQRGGFNTFGGGATGGPGITQKFTTIQGVVNVPIYQGGAEHAAVRQAKEFRAQADMNIVVADRAVREAVRAAWEMYQAAQASITSSEAQAKADTIAAEGVRREQQVGGRTMLDVLNAQQELLNSQLAVVQARRNTAVAAYQLLATCGRLTARDLALDVKLYDPLAHYEAHAARWIGLN